MSDSFVTRVEGPAPEMEVSRDIVRRGLIFTPLYLAVCGVIWGLNGVWSAGYAIAIVLLNFMLAALTISWAQSYLVTWVALDSFSWQ
jgi:hypothetical protein